MILALLITAGVIVGFLVLLLLMFSSSNAILAGLAYRWLALIVIAAILAAAALSIVEAVL